MLEAYLIRHPKTLGGKNVIKGHLDFGLMPGWEADTDALAVDLGKQGPFDAFYSSDLRRTLLPAERIVEYLKNRQEKPLELTSTRILRERNLGTLQGKKYEEVDTKGKRLVDYVFETEQIPKGESKTATLRRVELFVTKYLQEYINKGGRIGMVGHGWLINYLRNCLLGNYSIPFNNMKNLEMVRLSINGKIKERKNKLTRIYPLRVPPSRWELG